MEEQEKDLASLQEEIMPETQKVEKKFYDPVELTGEEDFYNKAGDNQKKFNEMYKKTKRINFIVIMAFMVVIIALIFLLKDTGAFLPVMAVIIVIYFVVLHMFSKKVKAKLDAEANKTIADFILFLDSYVTLNEAFSDLKFNPNEKLDEELFPSLKIVKDIIQVGGRDFIEGKVHGLPFIGGDCLVKTRETKEDGSTQDYLVFLGKLFVVETSKELPEGRAIIYLKNKGANGPTDIEDLTKVEDVLSSKYEVYSSCDLSNILNDEAKEILESFEVNDIFIDMFITIEGKRLSVGLSYSDGVMSVPLFEAPVRENIEQYKANLEKVVDLLGALK